MFVRNIETTLYWKKYKIKRKNLKKLLAIMWVFIYNTQCCDMIALM